MTLRTLLCSFALGVALTSQACAPKTQFYWGSYEDSLLSRYQHAGAEGEAHAADMLLTTITDAEASGTHRVGPGVHADYGYLLFKQGKTDEAIVEFQKEASLYQESKPLMNTMISRIQGHRDRDNTSAP